MKHTLLILSVLLLNFTFAQDCYSNTDCEDGLTCIPSLGDCEYESTPGICIDVDFNNICTTEIDYVCGCDGVTYGNECNANSMFGMGIAYEGECEEYDYGCTDPNAPNYNPDALYNDGSCDFTGAGYCCGDEYACNYTPTATCDDFTDCYYDFCHGCSDQTAINFDPNVIYDDGSCEYDPDPQIGDDCLTDVINNEGFIGCDVICVDNYFLDYLGDGSCIDSDNSVWIIFDCPEFGYDCGDCNADWDGTDPLGFCEDDPQIGDDCITGEYDGYYDCNMSCYSNAVTETSLGDGYCEDEDNWAGIDWNCPEFGYDCGDCNTDWDGSDPLGFCEVTEVYLGIGEIDLVNGTIEFIMNNTIDVDLIEFSISGLTVGDQISELGGSAIDNDLLSSTNLAGNSIMIFSMGAGAIIPPSEGALIYFHIESIDNSSGCIIELSINGMSENPEFVVIGDCVELLPTCCIDPTSCNYDPNCTEDDDNCIYTSNFSCDCFSEMICGIGDTCWMGNDEEGLVDCNGNCNLLYDIDSAIGNGECDSSFDCPEFGYDCGDCNADWDGTDPLGFCEDDPQPGDECVSGNGVPGYYDCSSLVCCDHFSCPWYADGVCNNGLLFGVNLNCPEFDCDYGDCGEEVDGECPNMETLIGEECITNIGGLGFMDCNSICQSIDLYDQFLGTGDCQIPDLYDFNFDCPEFGYDCGDCNPDWDDSDPLGFCETDNTTCYSTTDCEDGFACIPPNGDCNFATGPGECMEPGGACFDDWVPVCGCDGETYSNECYAHRDGMGIAYEGECEVYTGPTWHIAIDGSDENGDGSADNPFASIQHGIDTSENGDTVAVALGTYFENINYNGKNILVIGENRETTIIDGGQNGSVVTFENGEDSTTLLDGFTIQNGHIYSGYFNGGYTNYKGGGIDIEQSNPTLKNLIIQNNIADSHEWETPNYGGGICIQNNCNVHIDNVIIRENNAIGTFSGGGGIGIWESTVVIENSTIEDNDGGSFTGGGISSEWNSNLTILNSTIRNNHCYVGGGIYHASRDSGSLFLSQAIIDSNSSDNNGGGLYLNGENIQLNRVVISSNTSIYGTVGGAHFYESTVGSLNHVTVVNNSTEGVVGLRFIESIYLVNNSIIYDELFLGEESELDISFSNIQDGWDGEGNINTDPLFTNEAIGDFTLQPNSSCIDAGDPNSPLDPDGTIADMGAFYFNQSAEESDVTFTLGDIDYDNNTVEVWMENSIDIGGAQLWFSGFDIGGASGGLAGEYGWMVSGPANSVNLFDLQGGTIPPGSGIFFNIYIINVPMEDLCITQAVASDISAQELTVSIGDCIPYEETEVTLTFDCPESVVAGSEENVLPIEIEASEDIWGIQFEVPFDLELIEFTNVSSGEIINDGEMLNWTVIEDTLVIISFDFDSTPTMFAGAGNIFNLHYNVIGDVEEEIHLEFMDVSMVGYNGQQIEIDASDTCTITVVEPFTDQCVELFGLPWPECLAESGYGIYNGSCEIVYCGTFDGYGNDWSPWIYDTMEACEEVCPQQMVHFSVENQFAFTGDSIEVDIIMDNNTGSGGGIQMEILFDDEILGLNNVIAGAQYPPDWLLNFGGNTILGYSFNTTYLLMGSNQQLLQMRISAINEGMSIICMEDITVSDPNGQPHPTSSYCGVIQVEDMPLQHFTNILNGFENEYINYDDETGNGTTPIIFIEESDGVDIGDEIGLFDIGGVIGDECPPEYSEILVGASIFNGGPLEITTYGAIQYCDEDLLLPGFITGNEFIVKIWKAAENLEYPAYYNGQTGQLTWTPNNMNIPMLTPAPLISYDVNLDGELNVLDIILTVSIILGEAEELDITWGQEHTADTNSDGLINVIDILVMVNTIMEE